MGPSTQLRWPQFKASNQQQPCLLNMLSELLLYNYQREIRNQKLVTTAIIETKWVGGHLGNLKNQKVMCRYSGRVSQEALSKLPKHNLKQLV